MLELLPWVTCFVVLISNCGFWLYCYNRVGASGLPRRVSKRLEVSLIAVCFALPVAVIAIDSEHVIPWLLNSSAWWPSGARWFDRWGTFCLVSAAILGPGWLESRRWIWPPDNLLSSQQQRFDVRAELKRRGQRATANRPTALMEMIPGNEITRLEVNCKELQLPRSVPGIDGLKIGHLSDLHFTGFFSPEFHHFVIDQLLALQPQLIVITGDIIDYARCLPWLEPTLGRLRAPLGCTFVLGNHDKRIAEISEVTARLEAVGLFDAGKADQWLHLPGGGKIHIIGNERPWFERQPQRVQRDARAAAAGPSLGPATPAADRQALELGLSHSPDQIVWARRLGLDLLLAGHTHGGQVRLPGIGPLVSPSRFGSRFASGVFYREPVLMHVSRGVSGTHRLRWRCLPEVSLLTLRNPT